MNTTRAYIKSLSLPVGVYVVLAILILFNRSLQPGRFFFEAVSIDFIISAPLFYWIASRRFRTRTLLVFPLMAIGFSLSKLLLPHETVTLQWLGRFLLPLLELITIGSVTFYGYQFYKAAKASGERDAFEIIRKSCEKVFGVSLWSKIVATEFAVIYYALIAWRKKQTQGFTCYKDTGILTLYGFFIFIVIAETLIFHLLLIKINLWLAWIAFAASAYVAIQIFAHAKALKYRSVEISSSLKIRYGLVANTEIRFDQIQQVWVGSDYKNTGRKIVRIGLAKSFEPCSIAIELKENIQVEMLYGLARTGDVLLLPVDSPNEFKDHLNSALAISEP